MTDTNFLQRVTHFLVVYTLLEKDKESVKGKKKDKKNDELLLGTLRDIYIYIYIYIYILEVAEV